MEISHILKEALSGEQQRRTQAELEIDSIASQNFGVFLLNLSIELSDESKEKGIRQMASTIIKNMIVFTPKYKGQWNLVDPEIKEKIKQHVLSTLASSDKDIRKAAGFSVAGICKVELPQGQWPDIIDILCQTCQNENRYIRLASITTLEYIAQEIEINDLNDDQKGRILSAIYQLLSDGDETELHEMTVSCLLSFLPFTGRFFEIKEQKNLLLDLIYKYTNHIQINIRQVSVQCLLEIARHFYDFIEDNMGDLLSITKLHIEKDEEKVSVLCYEFWCSIGDIEVARMQKRNFNLPNRNICNRAYPQLLEVIFPHLLVAQVDADSDSWTVYKAASCLLGILSQCCEYHLIENVIEFIRINITSTASFPKEASILAFGAILETYHKAEMLNLVMNSIETLISFLMDENNTQSLKNTTAWVVERIAEIYGEEFQNQTNLFDKLYLTILGLLFQSKRQVTVHLCNAIHFFSLAFKVTEGQVSNSLSNHVKETLDSLLKLGFTHGSYDADNNVAMSAFYAIGSVIENAAPNTKVIVQNFFLSLIEAFKSTLDQNNFENTKMKYDYQAYISACIEPCLISGHVVLSEDQAKQILGYLVESFIERKCVYEEGLMACSSLALAIGTKFDNFVTEFGTYLIFSLNSTKDTSLCRTAIHSTSDIIRSIGPAFSKYINQILPLIINILADSEADKSLKPHSFNVISDVFVVCKENALPYFGDVMTLIGSALEAASLAPKGDDDFEILEYFELLREQILECLTCIFHSLKDIGKEGDFGPYVVPIVQFIHKINSKEYNPSLDIVKNSLGLIADFCESYKSKMKAIVDMNIIEDMIKKLKENSKSKKIAKTVLWAQKVIGVAMK